MKRASRRRRGLANTRVDAGRYRLSCQRWPPPGEFRRPDALQRTTHRAYIERASATSAAGPLAELPRHLRCATARAHRARP